jgi:CheY-like chemotaxis protein
MTGDDTAPHFGLVFMDLSMPVMDGYEAIERLRGLGKGLKFLPIVALTANALAEEKRRALEAGATEFNTKPILRNVLHATCAQHLGPPKAE